MISLHSPSTGSPCAKLGQGIIWLLFALLFSGESRAQTKAPRSPTQRCNVLLRQKKYEPAARCFRSLGEAMRHGQTLRRYARKVKALHLQRAAQAYAKAADQLQASNKEHAGYLREQAIDVLQRYLSEKLCSRNYQCKRNRKLQQEQRLQVGYATLTLDLVNVSQRKFKLTGYRFEKNFSYPTTRTFTLRPGQYRIVHTDQKPPLAKSKIVLAPNRAKLWRVALLRDELKRQKKATQANKARILPWALTAIGVGIAIAGGVLVGLGGQDYDEYRKQYEQHQTALRAGIDSPIEASTFRGLRESGQGKTITGSVLLGVGFVGIGIGVFLLLRPKPKVEGSSTLVYRHSPTQNKRHPSAMAPRLRPPQVLLHTQ